MAFNSIWLRCYIYFSKSLLHLSHQSRVQDSFRATCNWVHNCSRAWGHGSSDVKADKRYDFNSSLFYHRVLLFQWVKTKLSWGLWQGKFATGCPAIIHLSLKWQVTGAVLLKDVLWRYHCAWLSWLCKVYGWYHSPSTCYLLPTSACGRANCPPEMHIPFLFWNLSDFWHRA